MTKEGKIKDVFTRAGLHAGTDEIAAKMISELIQICNSECRKAAEDAINKLENQYEESFADCTKIFYVSTWKEQYLKEKYES